MSAPGRGKPRGQQFATRNMFNPEIIYPGTVVPPRKRGRPPTKKKPAPQPAVDDGACGSGTVEDVVNGGTGGGVQ